MRKKSKRNAAEESDAKGKLWYDEALSHTKVKNYGKALAAYNQALDLNPSDQNALVARSKCFLFLGEPEKALADAETALGLNKGNIKAIYQKGEALFFLGRFEHSLMFFHRGSNLRPEMECFRLGIQKSREAIENTIGNRPKAAPVAAQNSSARSSNLNKSSAIARPKTAKVVDIEKRSSRQLLGPLADDLEFLEKLVKDPNLKRADTGVDKVTPIALDAIAYLRKQEEFWRQQRPCTAIAAIKNGDAPTSMEKWF